jgi:hypothetical protein
MNTLDELLNQIVYNAQPPFDDSVLTKGTFKILCSIGSRLNTDTYITESQATLAHKIFVDNRNVILARFPEAIELLLHPKWKYSFRVIHQVRNIFIEDNKIIVDFNFNHSIKTAITELYTEYAIKYIQESITRHETTLTEFAVVQTLEKLSMYQFNMSDDIKEYYHIIKSWDPTDGLNTFNIANIIDNHLLSTLVNDVGDDDLSSLLVKDRSLRYQYKTDIELPNNTLSETIASRKTTKLWIDSTKHSMIDLITSLQELKRLPILFTFDTTYPSITLKNLSMVSEALSETGIDNNVGVYFRMKNTGDGVTINQLISNNKYNAECNDNTIIAAIDSRKLPKFLLETSWKPMAVVAVDHVLRAGRTAVYASCCDLIINYYVDEPIIRY